MEFSSQRVPRLAVNATDRPRPTVAIFSRRYHSVYGAQANVIRLASLMEAGECVMLTTAAGEFYDACHSAGVECQIVKTPKALRTFGGSILKLGVLKKLGLIPKLVMVNFRLWRTLRATGAKALLLADMQALPFALMTCICSRRKVLVYDQLDDSGPILRLLAGLFLDQILLIAKALEPPFIRSWPACQKRLRILHSGFPIPERCARSDQELLSVRSDFFNKHGIPDNAITVGLAGSMTRRKGGDVLVRAAVEVLARRPRTYFVFYGSSSPGHEEFVKDLQHLIEQLGLSGHVVLAGFQPRETIFASTDIVALPSRSEGLPSVLIEALSYGIAVVASDVAGVREIIRAPELGQIVPVDSPEALATALSDELAKLEGQRDQQLSLERARQEFARENFSDARYLGEFRDVLEKLCRS